MASVGKRNVAGWCVIRGNNDQSIVAPEKEWKRRQEQATNDVDESTCCGSVSIANWRVLLKASVKRFTTQ